MTKHTLRSRCVRFVLAVLGVVAYALFELARSLTTLIGSATHGLGSGDGEATSGLTVSTYG
jgi:hypothetical protein